MADNKENSMILKLLKDYLYDAEFFGKLDIGKYKVAYKNGILDLKTLEFREGLLSSDMLTKTIPYNYEKASDKLIAEIKAEIKKICNNNEIHMNLYEDLIKEVMKPSRVFKNPDYDYIEELFGD